jgi:pilus assembly protein CpaF
MNVVVQIQRMPEGIGRTLRFTQPGSIVLGRHDSCDLRLDSDQVSRQHARLTIGPDSFTIEDLSSNGTAVSTGEILRRARGVYQYGEHLSIGPFQITVADANAGLGRSRRMATGTDGPVRARPTDGPRGHHHARGGARAPRGGQMGPVQSGPVAIASHPPASYPGGQTPPPPVPMMHPHAAQAMHLSPSSAPAHLLQSSPTGHRLPTGPNGVMASGAYPVAPVQQRPQAQPAPPSAEPPFDPRTSEDVIALRRRIHSELLKNLDFAKIDPTRPDPSLRPRVLTALKRIVADVDAPILAKLDRDGFIGELLEEALGLGPLEPLLADPAVTEIMVVDPATIYVERGGKLQVTSTRFTDEERVRAVIERIVTPLGRRIDESQPLVDARLPDGSRVNAIIRPLALRGSCITIRRFPKRRLTVDDFIRLGSLTPRMAKFLERAVIAKKNVLISGGTGSGKTTLLNVLSGSIPSEERIVTMEDAAELQLHQPHVVSLETKHANMEGKGAFTIRDLVKNSLRMRPDRIVVGECRGGEALDMLQAMNTGHDGSLTTIHANSPVEALSRLETLVLMSGVELPSLAIREQISRSINIIIQQTRLPDGSRKITHISEIDELDDDGRFEVRPIFEFTQTGTDRDGRVVGEFEATGYLPSFIDELLARGIVKPGEPFL